jgi:hypothetical protein
LLVFVISPLGPCNVSYLLFMGKPFVVWELPVDPIIIFCPFYVLF